MTRFPRLLLRFFWLLLLLMALAALVGWWLVRGSLAQLDGNLELAGLSAPVRIERDALGVVSIHAGNEADAARALGYVHGQERYFEMDLLRRSAAGELSELFGEIAIEKDKSIRVHRLRARVAQNLEAIAGGKMPVLQCLHRRGQCGPRHASRAALALPAARRAAEGVDAGRLPACRLRDVLRPAGRGQLARTGALENKAGNPARALSHPQFRRHRLGRTLDRRGARQCRPAGRRPARLAQAAHAGRRTRRATTPSPQRRAATTSPSPAR